MNRSLLLAVSALCFTLIPSSLRAAEKESPIDPAAMAELKRMSDTLAAAGAFSYQSRGILEAPTPSGQTITLIPEIELALKRPDKIRVELRGEGPAYDFYYNGKTVFAFAPATNTYSQSSAPPTIDAMLPELEKETGIRLHSSLLLYSDPYALVADRISSAAVIGPAVIKGIPCQHLAFRSPGVDWEIWIEEGRRALPRRLVVNYRGPTDLPRVLIEYDKWNLKPWLRASAFTFEKPAEAREIPFPSVQNKAGSTPH